MGDHQPILMKIPKRGGVDRDTQRQPGQIPKTKETKRLQYHDQKLTDPIIREQYMAKLKQTSQVALQILIELSSTTPKNPSQSQHKADRAFEAVLACIDTAAQATIGSSMKSVNSQTRTRKPVQPREPSPEIQKLYAEKQHYRDNSLTSR